MLSMRDKSYTDAQFIAESNIQLRAVIGYSLLQRVYRHVWYDAEAIEVLSRLRLACIEEIGADLATLWTCTDLLIEPW